MLFDIFSWRFFPISFCCCRTIVRQSMRFQFQYQLIGFFSLFLSHLFRRHHGRSVYHIPTDRSIQTHYQMAHTMQRTNSCGIQSVHIRAQRPPHRNSCIINCPTVTINTIHTHRSAHNRRLCPRCRHHSVCSKRCSRNPDHIQ